MSERNITAGVKAGLGEQVISPHILCELDFPSGVVRFWTGPNDIDWNSQTWESNGREIAFSAISETTDGSSQGISIDVSGIDSSDVSDVVDDEFQDSDATIWLALYDADTHSLAADPFQMFKGKMDQADLRDDGSSATISIKCESRLINQIKRISYRYTNQDQQLLYPGDLGLEFVAGIQDKKVVWKS